MACLYEHGLALSQLSGMLFIPRVHEKNLPRLAGYDWLPRQTASEHACVRARSLKASPGWSVYMKKASPPAGVFLWEILSLFKLRKGTRGKPESLTRDEPESLTRGKPESLTRGEPCCVYIARCHFIYLQAFNHRFMNKRDITWSRQSQPKII